MSVMIFPSAVDLVPGPLHTINLIESISNMRANLIVWDLETVPDLGGFAAANDLRR